MELWKLRRRGQDEEKERLSVLKKKHFLYFVKMRDVGMDDRRKCQDGSRRKASSPMSGALKM